MSRFLSSLKQTLDHLHRLVPYHENHHYRTVRLKLRNYTLVQLSRAFNHSRNASILHNEDNVCRAQINASYVPNRSFNCDSNQGIHRILIVKRLEIDYGPRALTSSLFLNSIRSTSW